MIRRDMQEVLERWGAMGGWRGVLLDGGLALAVGAAAAPAGAFG